MSNVVKFPTVPRAEAVSDDAITELRKAMQRCVRERGQKTTALVIAEFYQIENTHDWRERHRAMLDRKETV